MNEFVETRDIQPGDEVIRMGESEFSFMRQFESYRVARFYPQALEGLELAGVPGRWNSQNFEVVGKPYASPAQDVAPVESPNTTT